MADQEVIDHRPVIDAILRDVGKVFGGPELETFAVPVRAGVERNRQQLAAELRQAPGIVALAHGAMRGNATPRVLIRSQHSRTGAPQVRVVPNAGPADVRGRIGTRIRERMEIYAGVLDPEFVLIQMSDGEELILTRDSAGVPDVERGGFSTSWSMPQTAGNLPHDRIGFLCGTRLLARSWADDVCLQTRIRTLADVVMLPPVPMKAAILMAVHRWPVVFSEPEFLRRQLETVVEVRAG